MKIDYNNYKESLINEIKSNDKFKDYNFTGSNISILMDIFSRNAHNYGFYANMLMRESSPQSAQRLESLKGYATRHSFLIRNNTAARTTLTVTVKPEDGVNSIYIPKNTKFASINELEQSITFVTLNDYTISDMDTEGNIYGDVVVHEGELKTNTIEVDDATKFYKIMDDKCDIDTLLVSVKTSISGTYGAQYKLADPNIVPTRTDNVFYLTLRGKFYEMYFGDDVFGAQPVAGQYIKLEYLKTMGSAGNGAMNFRLSRNPNVINNTLLEYYGIVKVDNPEASNGGYSGINKENLQLALSNFSRTKSIAINDSDYKAVILGKYSDINSIAVWGGEKHNYREYGKLFISIKPKYGRFLSTTLKEDIRNFLVKNYSLLAENIMFVDPNYMIINTAIVFSKNSVSKNTDITTIKSDLRQRALLYSTEHLGKFDLVFSENDFIQFISDKYENAYTNLYVKKELEYDMPLIFGNDRTYDFDFKNPILRFDTEKFLIGVDEAYYTYDKDATVLSDITLVVGKNRFKDHGVVNLDTGHVTLKVPASVVLKTIKLKATPLDNTIETAYDRILQIGTINVEVK